MPSTPDPHDGAPRGRTALAVIAVGAIVWTLTACTSPAPAASPTPSASASAEPIFASDEEALAAAVAAYEAYLTTEQSISESDSVPIDEIRKVATTKYAAELEQGYEAFRESSLRVTGRGTIDSARLLEFATQKGRPIVSIYACADVSDVRVVDATGGDVTPERDDRLPLVLEFEGDAGQRLLVAGSSTWTGDDFC